jgi:hypothetical protein
MLFKIITILILFLFISCNDRVVEAPLCICENFKITQDLSLQEGSITIPNTGSAYRIKTKKIDPTWGDYFIVCTDAAIQNQILSANIKDGSTVLFTGGIITEEPCNYSNSGNGYPYPSIKLTSIILK